MSPEDFGGFEVSDRFQGGLCEPAFQRPARGKQLIYPKAYKTVGMEASGVPLDAG